MSANLPKIDDSQELNLSDVSKGIGNIFRNFNTFLYNCVRFAIKNIVVLAILFIIGAGLGYFIDHTQKRVYTHNIIVTPNFGSTDYVYSKIELIDSKIKENDSVFLKGIGIQDPKDLVEIKITPIVDIFKFVTSSGNDQNFKLFELMAQDGDMKKIVTENMTSKNYPYHSISLVTRGKTDAKKTITPLMNYLNDNDYFRNIQKEWLNNVAIKLKSNDVIIAQIDAVLAEVAKSRDDNQKSLVYSNENTQLNDVIKTKDELIKEQGRQRVDLVGLDKVVKDNSTILNIRDKDSVNGKMKFVLPFLLIFLFLIGYAFVAFYKSQAIKHRTNQ